LPDHLGRWSGGRVERESSPVRGGHTKFKSTERDDGFPNDDPRDLLAFNCDLADGSNHATEPPRPPRQAILRDLKATTDVAASQGEQSPIRRRIEQVEMNLIRDRDAGTGAVTPSSGSTIASNPTRHERRDDTYEQHSEDDRHCDPR